MRKKKRSVVYIPLDKHSADRSFEIIREALREIDPKASAALEKRLASEGNPPLRTSVKTAANKKRRRTAKPIPGRKG